MPNCSPHFHISQTLGHYGAAVQHEKINTIDVTAVLLALLRRLSVWSTYTSKIALVALAFTLCLCCLCVALAVGVPLVLALVLPLIQIVVHISMSPKCLVAMDRLAIFDQQN